jgi:integrase
LERKRLTKKQDGTALDKETIAAYEHTIPEFINITGRVYANDVDDMDLRRYMAGLEKRGLSHRTICNYYTSIASFLSYCGIDHKTLLPRSERPVPQEGELESYTEEEIEKFFSVIKNDRDRLFFEFLLKTGARAKRSYLCRMDGHTSRQPIISDPAQQARVRVSHQDC